MEAWLPFIYQYAVGAVFCFGGIVLALKTGGASWKNPNDRQTIRWLIAGYFFYFCLHGGWILFARWY